MHREEKQVFYKTSNTYSTLNERFDTTENFWFVCHGLGYLSRFFINHFKTLDPIKNYIVAPQAQAKYYQSKDFKYVGASWLTKENTIAETKNVLNYLDAVYAQEKPEKGSRFILFGFSQGVSVSMRWMAKRKLQPDVLVIYAGSIPEELNLEDFSYMDGSTSIKVIYGKNDIYITPERLAHQKAFAERLFGKENLEIISFEGGHEVKPEMIAKVLEK